VLLLQPDFAVALPISQKAIGSTLTISQLRSADFQLARQWTGLVFDAETV
jgi:hypothetical protein